MSGRASLWRFWAREAPSGGTGGQDDPHALGRRIQRTALILTGGGFLLCLFFGGWSWALGFAIGAGVAVIHLEHLRQTVGRVLSTESRKVVPRLVGTSLLRLLGIGILLFLVLKFLPVSVISLALGLLMGPVAIVGSWHSSTDDLEEQA